MYFDYLKEREGKEHFETERGFMVYKLAGEECHLAEIYLKPEHRASGEFESMIVGLASMARSNGCKVISANVDLSDKGASRNVAAGLKVGFRIINAHNNIILLVKEL